MHTRKGGIYTIWPAQSEWVFTSHNAVKPTRHWRSSLLYTYENVYVHVPYIYVLGTVRQCKEDFVTVQLPCKPTYTWYIPVKAFSRQTLCRRYAAKDHILFNQNEKHDFNQILAYHFRIPAYHTTRFLIRIMSYTGIIPVNIPHCLRVCRSSCIMSPSPARRERRRSWFSF